MDTLAISNHLDRLLDKSYPFSISDNCVIYRHGGCKSDIANKLYKKIQAVLDTAVEVVDLKEISLAAKEKRQTIMVRPSYDPHWWSNEIPWEGTKDLWAHCLEQIKAIIATDNAERMEAYERYRLTCEQGVAVPPSV